MRQIQDEVRAVERRVREVPCPVCGVDAGNRCLYDAGFAQTMSHDGRYRVASRAGLVPRLVGMP